MKILTGRPILATFLPPQNHQNQQQQNFGNFANQHSRSRGVAKIRFGTPMLHGKRFFFLLLMQHGSAIFAFCNTSRARRRFFSFFQHLPSENHQNEENRNSKPCCGGVSAEGVTSKIGSKSASCPGIYDRDTFFKFTKKLTNGFNNVDNPPGISMITTSERFVNFTQFHNNSSQNLMNYNDFNNFNYSVFFEDLSQVKMHIQMCGAWPT